MPFTHLDDRGKAHIVDINRKPITERTAVARAVVTVADNTIIDEESLKAALFAGQQGAKQTSSLIPLCHPIPLENVRVDFETDSRAITLTAVAKATWRTGVEMEALTAVTVAALTILTGLDKDGRIDDIAIVEKHGGKSDPWGTAYAVAEIRA